ncbi:MAG: YkgJ family cysteine cluster protein [Archangium sp.]
MLCLTCGLCCDGTLFKDVALQPGEAERIRSRTRINEDGTRLLQGCSALAGDCRCGVYEDRPLTCRRYRCAVLRALEKNECTSEEAHGAIAEVIELRAELAARMKLEPRAVLPHIRATEGATVPEDAKPMLERLVRKLALMQLTSS